MTFTVVVHNDRSFAEQLVAALSGAGHEATAFPDPLAALAIIDTAERVEVLITQMQFARGRSNGAALSHMARAKWPDIRVIFMALAEFGQHADERDVFLPMPVSVMKVLDTVLGQKTSLRAHPRGDFLGHDEHGGEDGGCAPRWASSRQPPGWVGRVARTAGPLAPPCYFGHP